MLTIWLHLINYNMEKSYLMNSVIVKYGNQVAFIKTNSVPQNKHATKSVANLVISEKITFETLTMMFIQQ